MSELLEIATWLVYTLAAIMMFTVITTVILAGLALRILAEFLLKLVDGGEESDTQ